LCRKIQEVVELKKIQELVASPLFSFKKSGFSFTLLAPEQASSTPTACSFLSNPSFTRISSRSPLLRESKRGTDTMHKHHLASLCPHPQSASKPQGQLTATLLQFLPANKPLTSTYHMLATGL